MSVVVPDHASSARWSSHIWLLILVGLAAVIGGYWLPSQFVSGNAGQTSALPQIQAASAEQGTANSGKSDNRTALAGGTEGSPAAHLLRVPAPAIGADYFDLYGASWRLACATAAVLVLAVVFIWLTRRFLASRTPTQSSAQPLQISGELHLGARCRLLLIRVGQEQALVGLDGRGISAVLLIAPRFSELFEQANVTNGEPLRRRQGAILAAMVGEEDGAHGN